MEGSVTASHWDQKYETEVRSAFLENPIVIAELNRRITGKNAFWLAWLFDEHFTEKPKRLLSIGCGEGTHELIIARQRWAEHVEGFDISPMGISLANSKAQEEGLAATFKVKSFEDFISAPEGEYDAVLFIGALHHVKDLEGMLGAVKKVLAPGGAVIINEYCGPCYNIYHDSRVPVINGLLGALDPQFKVLADYPWTNPTVDLMISLDPTESVRSALIPAFMQLYFEPELIRPYGGAILHPIFPYLNGTKISDGSPESNTVIRLLIEAENRLTNEGAIPNDFNVGVYRKRAVS